MTRARCPDDLDPLAAQLDRLDLLDAIPEGEAQTLRTSLADKRAALSVSSP